MGMTAFNAAFAYNIQNAVTGNSPDFEVDYQKVLVSRGSLPNRANPAVAKGTDDNLVFTWTDNSGMGKALATDKTVLVIYCSAPTLRFIPQAIPPVMPEQKRWTSQPITSRRSKHGSPSPIWTAMKPPTVFIQAVL